MLATVLSFFLTCFGMFAIGFAAMATDSCGPDNCPSDITVPLGLMGYGVYAAPFGDAARPDCRLGTVMASRLGRRPPVGGGDRGAAGADGRPWAAWPCS
ncbi:hypothetical protein ABTZ57_27920 [Streptomyces sp. NPDC094048]|uniref:hypothetical protein n=1 Tax=Streptomyces sp. NPDC094048 TaxID=3155207 RepID=UPI003330517F